MQKNKHFLSFLAIGFVLFSVLIVAFYFFFLDLIVDYWWFTSLKLQDYFWLRLLYKYFILGGITLFFFTIFFFHFWIAAKFLGINETEYTESPDHISQKSKKLMTRFQTGALEA